jgi:hypothetical protein
MAKPLVKGHQSKKSGIDIIKMLDDLKESKSAVFDGYGENHNWTHKSFL